MIRRVLRGAAERVLGGAIAERRLRTRHPNQVLVLAFHNVVPDGSTPRGDRSLHLPLSRFRELIERLLELCRAVPLPAAPPPPAPSPSPSQFAVTFDDAYRGALTLALPELVRLGVPATVFVPTALIGDHDFWWDAIADPGDGLDGRTRRMLLHDLAGEDHAIRAWAAREGRPLRRMPPLWRTGTLPELRVAAALPGVTLGSHGARHQALDRLDTTVLDQELREPLEWFQAQGLRCDRSVAYPYGASSSLVAERAAAAGYRTGWLVSGGWLDPAADLHALPRLNVPAGATTRGLLLRAAGFLAA